MTWSYLFAEAGSKCTEVTLLEVGWRADLASEHTTSDWRVGNDSDAQLASGLQKADLRRLDVQAKWRVLDLKCVDVLHFACTTKRVGITLRQANVLDLALLLELLQLLNGQLNRRLAIETVSVVYGRGQS